MEDLDQGLPRLLQGPQHLPSFVWPCSAEGKPVYGRGDINGQKMRSRGGFTCSTIAVPALCYAPGPTATPTSPEEGGPSPTLPSPGPGSLGRVAPAPRPSPSHVRLHNASFLPLLFLNQTPSCPIPQDEDVREGEQTAGMRLSKRNSSPSFGLNKQQRTKTDITTSKTCFVSSELLMRICSFCLDQQNSYVLSATVLCKIITCW